MSSFPYTHAGEVARIWFTLGHKLNYYEIMPASDSGNSGGSGGRSGNYQNTGNDSYSSAKPAINIYPNPAQDNVTVSIINAKWDKESVIAVTDIYGRRVASLKPGDGNTMVNLNTQSWKDGVYFFSVHLSDGSVFNRKLVIQK